MEVVRPYGAEDNEVNMGMRECILNYCKKNDLEVAKVEIYGLSVVAVISDDYELQINQADGCRLGTTARQRNFWYMNEVVNGKRKRIKKENW